MNAVVETMGFAGFLVFCRVGACLMLVMGFASARVPPTIRLFLALSTSLALTPLILPSVLPALAQAGISGRLALIVFETMNGVAIGFLCRLFLAGLQFGATVAANAAGLAGIPGTPVEDNEPAPSLVSLMSLAGIVLIFALDLHLMLFGALVQSYSSVPVSLQFSPADIMERVSTQLKDVFELSLRLCAPFIVYGVVVNFAIGLISKFTPQVSIYFALIGLTILGGLLLLYLVADEWLMLFATAYGDWIATW